MQYLCDNFRYRLLEGFRVIGQPAVNATCLAAGTQLNPRPEGALAAIDDPTTDVHQDLASVLYATIFVSSATSDSDLDSYCANASQRTKSLTTMLLNATLVEDTICGVKTPMSTKTAKSALRTEMSRVFATIVENGSNVGGWRKWLCENVDAVAMEAVGLDGRAVQTQVCSDRSSST